MTAPAEPPSGSQEASERDWRRIYAGVIAFATATILILFLFSRYFSG